ncbi:hypothetical protein [Natronorubrum sp. DTA28]|uniref:hypothetical protein n=1 Tax=Natronorubrum sp. DTA28 TaxID=3447019 RepID=UPI003F852A02
MNRRTLLQSAGVAAAVGLAGCVDGVQEHFGLQGIIPIEIHNEGDTARNLRLQARERNGGRESYEQSYSVGPGETVGPPHLDETEQSFRAAIVENEEEATVRAVSITPDTSLVVIRISDDDLVVEVQRSEGEDEIADGTEGAEGADDADDEPSEENGDDSDENETDSDD